MQFSFALFNVMRDSEYFRVEISLIQKIWDEGV